MSLALVGINHQTAPLALRERFAVPAESIAEVTTRLLAAPGVREILVLSTCNRVEYLASIDEQQCTGLDTQVLSLAGSDAAELAPHLYTHSGEAAAHHLFRVASSLDSMVIGEPQILGQVKEAYSLARSVGAIGSELERLLQATFAAAKRIRTETQIGSNPVSIASVAVDLAHKIFGSLTGKKVLLVGAGKMGQLAARHLHRQGASSIFVANRTELRAREIADEFSGKVIPYDELFDRAHEADIVITSTGSRQPIFNSRHGQQFLQKRRNRPMFFIDIAVPRDVDPAMNKLDGIFVYDVDDLQAVAADHRGERARQAEQAEALVLFELARYQFREQAADAGALIAALQRNTESLRQAELRRNDARLASLSPEQRAMVESLTRSLMNKILHQPMLSLKAAARSSDSAKLDALCDAFDLNPSAAIQASPSGARLQAEVMDDSVKLNAEGEVTLVLPRKN